MATIAEIALRAGVSVKTVSRIMNNYKHVSAKTHRKVEAAIAEVGQSSNSVSRYIRSSSAQSIGILYSDPSGSYQSRLNYSLLKMCRESERFLAVEFFDETSAKWHQQVSSFLERTKVQSVILVPPMCDSSEVHALLNRNKIRFVLISPSRSISGASSISMDDRLAAYEMTRHLISLGHRRIGHMTGDPAHVVTLLRRQGYLEALSNAGLGVPDRAYMEEGRFHFKDAIEGATRMLSLPKRPTAIFAANDDMAAAVVMTATRLGLKVPEDLSVAGFDNAPVSQTMWPELTTIAQPFDDIARTAIDLLTRSARHNPHLSTTHVLPHSLIIRGSTGPVARASVK